MKFSLNWLKQYVDLSLSPEELSERLTMAGLEVESIERRGKGLKNVVIVRILDIKLHPNATKLTLCNVSDGEREYKIVCGAKNMASGDVAALAKDGAKLPPTKKFPDGIDIKTTKIRGELSEGMLAAENELGFCDESEGILILPPSAPVGARLMDFLGLDDAVFEVGVTPNRADCLSVLGIAREVAAILGKPVKSPAAEVVEEGEGIQHSIRVEVRNPLGCPRYSCRIIRDVKIAPSPEWLKSRLAASGIRSINNAVDVTNFVLMELGQPLHAFDLDRIEGGAIIVRSAEDGEIMETLDGVARTLSASDLLICDGKKPVALAGVMGAANTEISEATANILLESAYFNPASVRKTSKKTALRSESSYRFERGVDPNGVARALDRAAELIRGLSGGRVLKGRIDFYPSPVIPVEVALSPKRLNAVLGVEIPISRVKEIARSLEFELIENDGERLKFRIPTFRFDIAREIDLIEEIARHFGYGNILPTLPSVRMTSRGAKRGGSDIERAKETLLALGFSEAINYSFDSPESLDLLAGASPRITLLNPISMDASDMRVSLLSGIVRNVATNMNRQVQDIRIFEAGRAYIPRTGRLPEERMKIAGAAAGGAGSKLWEKGEVDFFYMKGIVLRLVEAFSLTGKIKFEKNDGMPFLHAGKSARIVAGRDDVIGFVGELSPDLQENLGIAKKLFLFEVDFDKIAGYAKRARKKFTPLPKFPSVMRDIALIVPEELSAREIVQEIQKAGAALTEHIEVFDVFRGGSIEKGKKSVAVAIALRANDKTLTDEDASSALERILEALRLSLGAELRKI